MSAVPQPPLESVVLGDRRVTVPANEPLPSTYSLCRQWVQQSDMPTEMLVQQLQREEATSLPPVARRRPPEVPAAGPPLEPPLPTPAAAATPAEPGVAAAVADGAARAAEGAGHAGATEPAPVAAAPGAVGVKAVELPSVDALLQHHKAHWKAVRQYHQQRAAEDAPRFAARLARLLQQA